MLWRTAVLCHHPHLLFYKIGFRVKMFSLLFLDLLCMEGLMLLIVIVTPIWQVIRSQQWLIVVSFLGWVYMITVMYAYKVRLH